MSERTIEKWCDYYDQPGQDCFTAGMAVIAAEGLCGPCAVRLIEGHVIPSGEGRVALCSYGPSPHFPHDNCPGFSAPVEDNTDN